MANLRLPAHQAAPVATARLALDPAPHPYEERHAAEIEANWRDEQARNPALFDGRTVLFSTVRLEEGHLEGIAHDVRYATLLHWRRERRADLAATASGRERPSDLAAHLFAMAVPVTSDGAVLTVRMAHWTANAGLIYFAGGSLEPPDFPDGVADLDLNMRREVAEETAIDLSAAQRDRHYRLFSTAVGLVVVRRHFLDVPAARADADIRGFVATEEQPEVVEPVFVRRDEPRDPALSPWVGGILDWHFANPAAD